MRGLSADTTNMNACRDDVHDRAPVRQGHVSAFPFKPFAVACKPLGSQLCLLSALTHGRFASSLCLCLCLCPAGAGWAGQSPRRDSQALCLTSSGLPYVVCFVFHPLPCVIAYTFRQFSGFICDGPEASNRDAQPRGTPNRTHSPPD